jgi:PAS domain S-box-containing protein
VPLIACIGALLGSFYLLDVAENELNNETREKEFSNTLLRVDQVFRTAVSNATTYAFTRQEASKESFERDVRESEAIYVTLLNFSNLSEEEKDTLHKMQDLEKLMFRQLRGLGDIAGDGDSPLMTMKIPGMRQQMQAIVRQFSKLANDLKMSDNLVAQRKKNQTHSSKDTRNLIKFVMLVSVIWLLVFGAGLAWFFHTAVIRRLRIVMDNAILLARRSPLLPAIGGKDEIGSLDAVFRKMARSLEEASAKERALIENAVDVICSIDLSNRFTEVNPAAEKLWGYTSDDLMGRRIVDIIYEADVPKTLEMFEQCSNSSKDAELESRVKTKSGEYIHSLWSLKWVADKKSFFCVIHDINDRKVAEDLIKESESRLRMMVECLPMALFLSTPDGTVETANIRAEQMYGYVDNSMVGLHVADFFKPEKGHTQDDFIESLNDKFIGKVVEMESVRNDGSIFPAEISVNSYVFGATRMLLIVALDVTERHEIERFKQDLIAMVSHDLRSPLTSVQGLLSMMEEGVYGDLNDRGQQSVKRSQADLDRLLLMIDELLDIEKMSSGKLQLNFEVVDLRSVMTHSVSAINHLANKKDIKIRFPDSSLEAFGDGAKLVQVVVNLLSNAIKFSPEGGEIEISYLEVDDSVEVRIKDEGRGIPASHLESIFDKFQQVEAADHKEKGGKGLGLAICQSIIMGHGGTIGAENNEEKGSMFWFKIPQPQ